VTYREMVYLPQTVTHPSSNRAQCRLTMLIKANVLTSKLRHHPKNDDDDNDDDDL